MSEAAPGRAPPEAAASGNPDSLVVVLPEGYRIRELTPSDAAGLADAYRRNRQHLAPWEPVRDESFFTEEGQVGAVAGQLAMVRHGQVEAWLLTHGERVVGRVNLNNIMMGVLRSGNMGSMPAVAGP